MPKAYTHTKRGKTMNYNYNALEEAFNAVQAGMPIRKVSVLYNIPKSTLGDRISGKHNLRVMHGRPPAIPADIELKIVRTLTKAASLGMGLSRKQILLRTNALCKRLKIKSSYSHFRAGKNWWDGLRRRDPALVIRKPERLTSVRARMVNQQVVGKFFDDLGKILGHLNLSEAPKRIWNCDESGLNFEHAPVRVVAQKGESGVVSRTSARSSNISVMTCVSASGKRMPPLMIVKGKTSRAVYGFNMPDAPTDTMWTQQPKGWMTDEIGEVWFNNIFLKHCGPQRPQLLILDGHSSHESLAILERAIEEKITILSLPPHCTHVLQPLDKTVFGPMKSQYNASCSDFMQQHPLHQINKWSFPSLFREAWDAAVAPSNIQKGSKVCGIYTFSSSALPDSVLQPSLPTNIPLTTAVSAVSSPDEGSGVVVFQPSLPTNIPLRTAVSAVSSPDEGSGVVVFQPSLPTNIPLRTAVSAVSSPDEGSGIVSADHSLGSFDSSQMMNFANLPANIPEQEESMFTSIGSGIVDASSDRSLSSGFDCVDVLDISDPTQLLELISSGDLIANDLRTTNESNTDSTQSLAIQSTEVDADQIIETVFMPRVINNRPKAASSSRTSTSHKLSTSPEVLQQKRLLAQRKAEKENKVKTNKKKVKI